MLPKPVTSSRFCFPNGVNISHVVQNYASIDCKTMRKVTQVAQRAACHQVIKTVNEYGMLVESETILPGGEIQVVVRTF
jgi:hypothetical protein